MGIKFNIAAWRPCSHFTLDPAAEWCSLFDLFVRLVEGTAATSFD